jgi:hypothetical protein
MFARCACVVALAVNSAALGLDDVDQDDVEQSNVEQNDFDLNLSMLNVDAALAQDEEPPPAEPIFDDSYKGGRGLITAQGMTGMFLNPTSGTLPQGHLTIQYCVLLFQNDGPNNTGHGLLGSYGVTDWLEIGGFGTYADANAIGEQFWLGAPFVRIRLLKDEEWWPEVSIGGIHLWGDSDSNVLSRTEFVVMASKRYPVDEEGFIRALRPHIGMRQIWYTQGDPPEANATLAFGGIEVELPYSLSFVAEISNKDDFSPHLPWAVGMQWKPNDVLGLSLAITEPGSVGGGRVSPYIGIGVNFEF